MSSQIEKLHEIGFENVGTWSLGKDSLSYEIRQHENERSILYAFVADQDVKYIGKSTRPLKQRMNGYRKPGPSQMTNIKGNQGIIDLLKRGVSVQIYVFVQKEPLCYRGFRVNLAAGLEDDLIRQLEPEWNEVGQ